MEGRVQGCRRHTVILTLTPKTMNPLLVAMIPFSRCPRSESLRHTTSAKIGPAPKIAWTTLRVTLVLLLHSLLCVDLVPEQASTFNLNLLNSSLLEPDLLMLIIVQDLGLYPNHQSLQQTNPTTMEHKTVQGTYRQSHWRRWVGRRCPIRFKLTIRFSTWYQVVHSGSTFLLHDLSGRIATVVFLPHS
jgi:hypothetical protein